MKAFLLGGFFLLVFLSFCPSTTSSSVLMETLKHFDHKEHKGHREHKEHDKEERRKMFEKGLMMKDKPVILEEGEERMIVIVRWNENLTWVRDYFPNTPTTVIQKANDQVIDHKLKTRLSHLTIGNHIDHQELTLDPVVHFSGDLPYLKNLSTVKFDYISNTHRLGRECSGYIWWILENYDNLPTWVMFVHGAPEKSASIAKSYLTQPRGKFQSFAGNIVNRCFEKYNGEEGRGGGEYFLQNWEDLMREVGIEPPHCMRNFCCANFVVHRDRIQILSKESWRKLLLYVLLPGNGPGWRNNCYHLEHFWHMLMGEPSHTYIGFAPHPDSQASRILSDNHEAKRKWEDDYRPYMKPERGTRFG